MNSNVKILSYLLAANMEAVALFLGAWWVGQWLDNKYPQNFSWMLVVIGIAVIVLLHSWYVIFSLILKTSKTAKTAENKSPAVEKI